jgi:hypothetical protein
MVAGADLRRAVRLLACVTGVSDNPYSNVTLRISLRIHHLQEHKTKKPSSQTPVEKHSALWAVRYPIRGRSLA